MKSAPYLIVFMTLSLLSACGGGSGGSSSSSLPADDFAAGGANVVAISVNAGPASCSSQNDCWTTFNIPMVTVTVCEPGTSTCASIPDVLVDTGSSGLRLIKSVLTNAGISLTPMTDPNNPGNTLAECLEFADGHGWGAVATATVQIGGESTTQAIPVQVLDDSSTPSPTPPTSCGGGSSNTDQPCAYGDLLNCVNAFDANGVLGVSTFNQDCGSSCEQCSSSVNSPNECTTYTDMYYTCNSSGNCCASMDSSGNCVLAPVASADQLANPVASFKTDNNGVIVQLQSVAATGATTASGYLVFGIGTESNNTLGSATVLTANDDGNFTTNYSGVDGNLSPNTMPPSTLPSSFIDSGSNALFFNDPTLTNETQQDTNCVNSGIATAGFYCPTSTVSLSATNQGANGTTSSVSFQVANLYDISDSYFAINDVAGSAPQIPGFGAYFDWGVPFFYGRSVFVAIENPNSSSYPYGYYAY